MRIANRFAALVWAVIAMAALVAPPAAVAQDAEAPNICAISPSYCTLMDMSASTDFRLKPEIEFDVCDIWADACAEEEISQRSVRAMEMCRLTPDQCKVTDLAAAVEAAQRLVDSDPSQYCRLAPDACQPKGSFSAQPGGPDIPFDICDIWPERCGMSQKAAVSGCALVPEACMLVDESRAFTALREAMDAAN